MKKKYSTKRALIASVLALCMCFSMLVGTTFAWFTDSVTSANNIIKSGSLEIALEKWNGTKWEDASTGPIFNYDKWEPGYTQVVNLKVSNNGTLALKWQAGITTEKNLSILADVISVYVRSGDDENSIKVPTDSRIDLSAGGFTKYTLRQFIDNASIINNGELEAGKSDYLGIVLKMEESAGNEYQNLDLGGRFDLKIFASQLASESDSFGKDYDLNAPFFGSLVDKVPDAADVNGKEYIIYNDKNEKVGTITATAGAFVDNVDETSIKIGDSTYTPNITVAAGLETLTFDITVSNVKENNTEDFKVKLFIGKNLDPATVKVYHYDTEITDAKYAPETGYVTFNTTSFSPFTLVYDAESVYVPPVVDENDTLPKATVTAKPEYVNVDLPWGSYGQWSPTEGLDSKLAAAFEFKCQDTLDEAKASDYANWHCDFFVKLDRDLTPNSIFLGGNYGSFGWIGFHNGDLTLDAETEIPLLGSVAGSWTYLDVVQSVGTFTCGVGDVGEALDGATFTVMLRLTNPENENDYTNVATIEHTFAVLEKVSASTQEEFANAVKENNYVNVNLSAGEYTMPDGSDETLRGKDVTIIGDENTVIDATNIDARNQFVTGASLTFDGVTINFGSANYMGFANTKNLVYKNCTINGLQFLYGDNVVFENCVFNSNGAEHSVWTYGAKNVSFVGCDFTYADRAVNVYLDNGTGSANVSFEGCTFATSNAASKGAVEINSSVFPEGVNVSFVECDAPEYGTMVGISGWDGTNGASATVTVDGAKITATQWAK